jgi:ferrous iron transport protein A
MSARTVSHLRKGEKGIIKSFTDRAMSLKLLEMGCLARLRSPAGCDCAFR